MASSHKETPRQKMIGLMYLVLTCLLALNVSQDVLKGFITVNESLERTNESMQLSNLHMMEAFEASAKESVSARAYYQKALYCRRLSTESVLYLEELKKKLIEITEKVSPEVADTLHLRHTDRKDDYDSPTFQLIGDDENALRKDAYSATELRTKLTTLHTRLNSMIDSMMMDRKNPLLKETVLSLKEKTAILLPKDPLNMEEGVKMTWELQNFYHLPLAAVITNLSKIEADIKNVENIFIQELASASGKKLIKINQFAARVVSPSKYIRLGEKYSADILLAGSSSDFNKDNMQILLGARYDSAQGKLINPGTPLPIINGFGKLETNTSATGEQKIEGVIAFKNPLGEMEYYNFEDRYTVASAQSSVAADKMNVFYAGLGNDLTVSAAGVAPENIVLKTKGVNATLQSKGQGKYSIVPSQVGTCELQVYSKESDGTLKLQGPASVFRVKSLPIPFVKINGKYAMGSMEMSKLETMALSTVLADIPGFDFNARFKIKSFVVSVVSNGQFNDYPCSNGVISSDAKAALSRIKTGSRFFIEKVVATNPLNQEVKLGDVVVRVKG